MPLIRYPGSKAKLVNDIIGVFPDVMRLSMWSEADPWEYREPFFGAGAIGFEVLSLLSRNCTVWLNDKDPDIAALWQAVSDRRLYLELVGKIARFTPSAAAFYEFKERDGSDGDVADRGFRKLALHRMSVSGFGFMSGGPIGGRAQTNERYNVQCRWNPERMKLDIVRLHKLLAKFTALRVTCLDFAELLSGASARTFVYLDPPYYEKGPMLYKHSMTDIDHERLAEALRNTDAAWALSYDDHPEIRRLYSWARFSELSVRYSNAVTKEAMRPKNKEVLIVPNAA